jgi:hypothetical protein
MATRASARGALVRSAVIFSPFFAVTLFALAFIVQDVAQEGASGGRIVGLVLVGGVALLLGYQVVQTLRDLLSSTVETVGIVDRQWRRNELFVFRNDYIFVGRNVFRIEPERAVDVRLGATVRVVHYPHTSTVESIEVVEPAAEGPVRV